MTNTTRHDAWSAGDSYEAYMGRWSREIALRFLDWLPTGPGLDWVEGGCGTGALSASITARCSPRSLAAVDPSAAFVEHSRTAVSDTRATFQVGDAQSLPLAADAADAVVSGLVLNFVPDRGKAISEMVRVARAGGTVAFYVWDYPGGGVEFMDAFWSDAAEVDPEAAELAEGKRFPYCNPEGLFELVSAGGLTGARCEAIEIPTVFRDIDDFWHPFTLGAGPGPGYCVRLEARQRDRLRDILRDRLPVERDGSIALAARAWAVRADVS